MKNLSGILLLSIIVVFFYFDLSYAQWYWQNPLPHGNENDAVCFIDINTGIVAGGAGAIVRTTDGGATWNIQQSSTVNWLYAMSFPDANNGTAVGENGTIIHTTNGG